MLFSREKNSRMEEIRNFLQVSQSAGFDSLAPHIVSAERDYLIPVIGTALYGELYQFYNREYPEYESGSDELTQELLEMVQSAVVHLAYWTGFDLLNAHVSDGGFRRIESESVKGLYKYQEDQLKSYFRSTGFNRLDHVLEFLETHQDDFETYQQSKEYLNSKSDFISTTEQFNELVFIGRSRLTFMRMKGHLRFIEDTEILKALGDKVYQEIKGELIKESPADKVTAILPYIRKPLAYLASALLMEESGADLTDNGLYFQANKAIHVNSLEHTPATAERIALLVKRNRDFGYLYLEQLKSYLGSNSDSWPDAPEITGPVFRRDNTAKKSFWQ